MANATEAIAALKAAGIAHVYSPESPEYKTRTSSYWSVSARLAPAAIVQPTDTAEVATALKTMVGETSVPFAVRGGGHMVWPGSNNIDGGVTIDLGLLNQTTYDADSKLASVGAGSHWGDVYKSLTPLGVTVGGGRAATVGVAGFLMGGGNSFYAARYGFSCDSVVNYEVVLASGEVINANAEEHADLFRALKGGSANFGIVTRFDMQAFETGQLWGGVVVYPKSTSDLHAQAHVSWTNNVHTYPYASAIAIFSYLPIFKDIIVIESYVDTSGKAEPEALSEFLSIPDALSSTLRHDSHLNLTVELEQAVEYHDIWFSITFKNDLGVLRALVDSHERFVDGWKAQSPDGDFITQFLIQPIPTLFAQRSAERGGNVLGLDRARDNLIMVLGTLAVKGSDQNAAARDTYVPAWRAELQKIIDDGGAHSDWVYLNYADPAQNPIKFYGEENIAKIRSAAGKYDPLGVFQTRSPGGFKISKV